MDSFVMTLHDAIKKILEDKGSSMTTNEIADELNKKSLYQKKDNTEINRSQVSARIRKYQHIFTSDSLMISLK